MTRWTLAGACGAVPVVADAAAAATVAGAAPAGTTTVGAAGGGAVPAGALAVAGPQVECEVAARVIRLLRPPPGLGAAAICLVLAVCAVLVAGPAVLLLLPLR